MDEISEAELIEAATTLLGAPVRGAPRSARFVEAGAELAILVDVASRRIGAALARAAQQSGATANVIELDRPQDKPLKVLPPEVRAALASSQCAVFAARAPNAERSMREQLAAVVKATGQRHVRLPDVTERMFARGIRADQRIVVDAGKALSARLATTRTLEVESPAGTRLRVDVTAGAWAERLGEVAPGVTVGYPAGALYTSPESVEGTFVADASLGEFFGAREGLLAACPVRFYIEAGTVVRIEAPHSSALERDLHAMLAFAENSNRVGLVVLGVHGGIEGPCGDATVDQNLPGLHLGLGDVGGRTTTAVAWKARTAFAACQSGSRVTIEGRKVVEAGRLVATEID